MPCLKGSPLLSSSRRLQCGEVGQCCWVSPHLFLVFFFFLKIFFLLISQFFKKIRNVGLFGFFT